MSLYRTSFGLQPNLCTKSNGYNLLHKLSGENRQGIVYSRKLYARFSILHRCRVQRYYFEAFSNLRLKKIQQEFCRNGSLIMREDANGGNIELGSSQPRRLFLTRTFVVTFCVIFLPESPGNGLILSE